MASGAGAPESSVFAEALTLLPSVRGEGGAIHLEAFCKLCRTVLPVIDRLGTGLAIVRNDINGNIVRLEKRVAATKEVLQILSEDSEAGDIQKTSSDSNALLWLKRAMEFIVEFLNLIILKPSSTLTEVATESYQSTLSNYHGMIVRQVVKVAFLAVPARDRFIAEVGGAEESNEAIPKYVAGLKPLLEEIHQGLDKYGLNQISA